MEINKDYIPVFPKDIQIYKLYRKKDDFCVISSEMLNKNLLVSTKEARIYQNIINSFGSSMSLEQVAKEKSVHVDSLIDAIKLLGNAGLIKNYNIYRTQKSELKIFTRKIYSIKLNNIYEYLCKINNIFILFVILTSVFFLIRIYKSPVSLYKVAIEHNIKLNIILSFLIMIPSFMIHEYFHVLLGIFLKARPVEINVVLYMYIFPMFYVKFNNLYSINYKKRIVILMSGFLGNIYLILLSSYLYVNSQNTLWLAFILAQINIIVANLNPFNLSDMYFIMSNILKQPNLRSRFFKFLSLEDRDLKNNIPSLMYGTCMVVLSAIVIFYYLTLIMNVINIKLGNIGLTTGTLIILLLYLLFISCYWRRYKN